MFGRRKKTRAGWDEKKSNKVTSLAEAVCGKHYRILNNPDLKTMEMGLHKNVVITINKNDSGNPNIVIGVGDTRLMLSHELAKKILITDIQISL